MLLGGGVVLGVVDGLEGFDGFVFDGFVVEGLADVGGVLFGVVDDGLVVSLGEPGAVV